jgi:hypothetical protein
MRLFAAALIGLGAMLASAALASPAYPDGAVALEKQLLAPEDKETLDWIKGEAAREAALHNVNELTPRNAARKYGAGVADTSKLAFLVLMAAARVADSNVSELVNGVQSVAASKQDLRQVQMRDNVIAGTQQQQLSGGEQSAQQAQGHAFLSLLPEDPDDNPVAQARRGQAIPPPSMTLQDAMDRQNQIEDLLDKAMKRVSQSG